MTVAVIGYNSKLAIYNGSGFDDVAEVVSLTPPQFSRDAVDATHMQSPSRFREYVAGLMDAGEVQIEINYIPSLTHVIMTAMTAGVGQFQITHPSGIMMRFYAVVTSFAPSLPIDDKMSATATFKISGLPTWFAA